MSERGNELRQCFMAKNVPWAPKRKRVLIGGDLSQAEYRMLAHEANCKPLLKAFAAGHDFHASTAADIFGGKWEQYTNKKDKDRANKRQRMKTVNFMHLYGAGGGAIAAACGIPEKEGFRILSEYADAYPEIETWKAKVRLFAHKNGYSETLFGGRVHVPHIKFANQRGLVKMAERQAINGVIQGGCADYVRIAMADCTAVCDEYEDAWLLLQVHDELVFECYEDDVAELAPRLRTVITTCTNDIIKWRVKFESDVQVGNTWAEIKG